jgi:hypothetical protein
MPAENRFDDRRTELNSPARRATEVTPSDADELPFVSRWLYVGAAGDLRLTTVEGDTITMRNVPAGSWQYVMARQVLATGTTAADIVAFA